MASSHKTVIVLFVLLLLTPSMLHARMAPSDHARADQAQHVSMPPSPPSGEPEMAMVAAKRWGTTQVTDGSVPSPGIGH
ncbi:hypothetical protein HU200_053242 [Digitaria exilis]|uniref:Uncharacterized protein n=1 Tax=Digitaria exilis TaxID=1010633 RepID=A0A835E8P1_9POAL|nr:hypothetical protein HU200_053242 [Digitaria exilis]